MQNNRASLRCTATQYRRDTQHPQFRDLNAAQSAGAGADMGTVNLSLSELVTGGPSLDGMHEAHHVHHQVPGAGGAADDLQPDEETAEDEVRAACALAAGPSNRHPPHGVRATICGWFIDCAVDKRDADAESAGPNGACLELCTLLVTLLMQLVIPKLASSAPWPACHGFPIAWKTIELSPLVAVQVPGLPPSRLESNRRC